MFTRRSLSLFRVLSPRFMFSCTTIASIIEYFKCFVSYCYALFPWKWNLETIPWIIRGLSLVLMKLPTKNYECASGHESGHVFQARLWVHFRYVTEMHWPRRPGKPSCRQLRRTETMLKSDQPFFLIFPLAFLLSLTLILSLTPSLTLIFTPTVTLDLGPS